MCDGYRMSDSDATTVPASTPDARQMAKDKLPDKTADPEKTPPPVQSRPPLDPQIQSQAVINEPAAVKIKTSPSTMALEAAQASKPVHPQPTAAKARAVPPAHTQHPDQPPNPAKQESAGAEVAESLRRSSTEDLSKDKTPPVESAGVKAEPEKPVEKLKPPAETPPQPPVGTPKPAETTLTPAKPVKTTRGGHPNPPDDPDDDDSSSDDTEEDKKKEERAKAKREAHARFMRFSRSLKSAWSIKVTCWGFFENIKFIVYPRNNHQSIPTFTMYTTTCNVYTP